MSNKRSIFDMNFKPILNLMKHLLTILLSFTLLSSFAQVPVLSPITGSAVICSSSAITASYYQTAQKK